EDCKLVKIQEKNGYSVEFAYNKSKSLDSIKDSEAKQIFFSWHPDQKRVKEIWSVDSKRAQFTFDSKYNLTKSVDVGGNTYKFKYDGAHNLTVIDYIGPNKIVDAKT